MRGGCSEADARLQEKAEAGVVILNDNAHRRIASSSTASKWITDPIRLDLKGIDEPVKAFRLAPPNRP
jgi:class 3 adenylate cyclase